MTGLRRAAALAALTALLLCSAAAGTALAGALADIRAADQAKTRGDFTSAMQLYNKALRSGELAPPRQAGVHFKRGTVFGVIGDRPAMLADYARAVELNPRNTYFRLAYGGALMQDRAYDLAREQFEAAGRLEPDSVFPVSSLGMLYWEQGDYPRAESHLKRAVEMKPASGWELEKLATFHLSLGRYARALSVFAKAAELEPDSPELPLLQYLCASLAGRPAPKTFEQFAAKAAPDVWPGPVYLLCLDKLSPKSFLAWLAQREPAENERLASAARYYLAYWRLMRGETGMALKNFAWLADNAPLTSLSGTAARAELRRRGK